jgi:L-fuconolactonase
MRIDSHHHIWDLSVRDQEWIAGDEMQPIRRNFSISDLRDASATSRIDRTVLVQTVTDYSETPELLEIAQSEQLVGAVVGWLQIDAPDAIAHLHQYLDLPGAEYLKGIRDIAQRPPGPKLLGQARDHRKCKKAWRTWNHFRSAYQDTGISSSN